jgi:hypothetical protein
MDFNMASERINLQPNAEKLTLCRLLFVSKSRQAHATTILPK